MISVPKKYRKINSFVNYTKNIYEITAKKRFESQIIVSALRIHIIRN